MKVGKRRRARNRRLTMKVVMMLRRVKRKYFEKNSLSLIEQSSLVKSHRHLGLAPQQQKYYFENIPSSENHAQRWIRGRKTRLADDVNTQPNRELWFSRPRGYKIPLWGRVCRSDSP